MYLGFWLLIAGALVIYRTWVLAAYLAVAMARFVGRARMEERTLADVFGQDWTDYADHVPMWIPWRLNRGRREDVAKGS
jgi:protein-S-isoprenylcysteine O-methyltransferase Ste14